MEAAEHSGWYQTGLIWKYVESENRRELNEDEEKMVRHYMAEKDYRQGKHKVVKVRINQEIMQLVYRRMKKQDEGTLEDTLEDNLMRSKPTLEEANKILCPPVDLEKIKDIARTQEDARQ